MLKELRVSNFAIIDELSLGLGKGLSVLTGETGAGKSIIVGALSLALGERASSEMIKTGSIEASVEAFFDIHDHPLLNDMGIDGGEGIIIRRSISGSGKSKAYINNTMATLQSLSALGATLVDLHGQHEHQSLLSSDSQMQLLDNYGGLVPERERVAAMFEDVQGLRGRLEALRQGGRERAQRLDLLRFQISEIDAAVLGDGEEEALKAERGILTNLWKLNELLEESYGMIYSEEGSAIERLSASQGRLGEMAGIDPEVSGALEVLNQALPLVEEVSISLRSLREKYQMDPARLSTVEERLNLIDSLKRKYGDSVGDILAYREGALREAETLEHSEENAAALEEELDGKEKALLKACGELTDARTRAARKLEPAIKGVLKELALEKAAFSIDIKDAPLTSSGGDAVEFMFSANKGEALKPLKKVASGGELSRVMLAVKSVLRSGDGIPVLVFDEVDTGIGGKTAQNVAARLKALAADRQVLCITHLPQIASVADRHFLIEKTPGRDSVRVGVRELKGRQREEEIARMLSGDVTETSLKHAREIMGRSS